MQVVDILPPPKLSAGFLNHLLQSPKKTPLAMSDTCTSRRDFESGPQGANVDDFGRRVLQGTERGKTNVTKEAHMEAMWETFGNTTLHSAIAQFIFDTLVFSLATFAAEGNLLPLRSEKYTGKW